jgi:hypothetical protein
MNDARHVALDAYLAERRSDGYSVETRTGVQAVIIRRRRPFLGARWVGWGFRQRRLVVSVDQDGSVTSVAAEPIRW